MMGDALARRLGQRSFSSGKSSLLEDDATRRAYTDGVRTADRYDTTIP